MNFLINTTAFLIAFCGMEFMAWFTHKYVMHGFLWNLHKDHHQPNHDHFFEKNDAFFLIYAIPSWLCIMLGMIYNYWYIVAFGFGIMAYGITYFLFHDILIHRRFKWFDKIKSPYLNAIRRAHAVHHVNENKEDGTCFGLLIFPYKYLKEQKERK